MTLLTKRLEKRVELIRAAFDDYDKYAGQRNWIEAGRYAAEARDLALVGDILCRELAESLDSIGYGSAAEFYRWADEFNANYRSACAILNDVEVYING